MPKSKTKSTRSIAQRITRSKTTENNFSVTNWWDKIRSDLDQNQAILNIILGGLIVLVVGVLVYNYFNKPVTTPSIKEELGPSQQTSETTPQGDVTKEQLPGKYTVKEGDTLFKIAEYYYGNGYLYPRIVEANKLANENYIEVGQVLEIPKVEASELAQASPNPEVSAVNTNRTKPVTGGIGGAENQTIWGEKITGDIYVVKEGDWLSKIAGRAYGDIMAYDRIAQANNIANPDLIYPGQVLKIPRQ